MAETKQFNVRLEPEHAELVRTVIDRLRRGGPAFRAALTALIDSTDTHVYLPASHIHARFDALEVRLARVEAAVGGAPG
jgi:NADH:ubiquinone oxidoreductase subunit E